jgi:zinc protease
MSAMSKLLKSVALALAVGTCLSVPVMAQTPQVQNKPDGAAPLAQGAILTGRTSGGIRMTFMSIPDAKELVVRFVWADRSVQYQPETLGAYALATSTIMASGYAGLDGGALQEELNDLNAGLFLSSGPAFAIAGFTAPNAEIKAVAQHFTRLVTEPRVSEVQLRRRKQFLLNSLTANDRSPESYSGRILRQASLGTHPVAAIGEMQPRERIMNASVGAIESWRKARLGRSNLHAFVIGQIRQEDAASLVDSFAEKLPQDASAEPPIPLAVKPHTKTVLVIAPVEQTQLQLGSAVAWDVAGEEGVARGLAATILGGGIQSRLFTAIRERLGAAYGASAGFDALSQNVALFSMRAAVQHDKALDALKAFRDEYGTFRSKGVTSEELNPIKQRWQAGFRQSLRVAGSAANVIVGAYTSENGPDWPNRYAGTLAGIDAAGINRRLAERMPEKLATIIVAPKDIGFNADCTVTTVAEAVACLGN